MTYPNIHPDQLACRGCSNFHEIDGQMDCLDLISFDGSVPDVPPCFEFHPAFLDALKKHNAITYQCGAGSAEQRESLVILMNVSPPEIIKRVGNVFTDPFLINAINQSQRK